MTWRKASPLSQARAKATAPERHAALVAEVSGLYASLHAAGKMASSRPEASQIFNVDEKGIAVNGPRAAVVAHRGTGRLWRTVGEEKSEWWTSAVVTTCADGTVATPPYVIHKGVRLTEEMALNLPHDALVAASPSGYITPAFFLSWSEFFIRHRSSAELTRPNFLFIDGYGSHANPEAIRRLLQSNIHVVFLCTHASAQQQPNDKGPNTAFAAAYGRAMVEWEAAHSSVVRADRAAVNACIAAAWRHLRLHGAPGIVTAFAECGIHPLAADAPNFQPAVLRPCLLFLPPPPPPQLPLPPLLAPPPPCPVSFDTTPATVEGLRASLEALKVDNDALRSRNAQLVAAAPFALTLALPPHLVPAPGAPVPAPATLLLRAAAFTALSSSTIQPAAAVAAEQRAHSIVRKRRLPVLDTTRGAVMTGTLLERLEADAAAKAAQAGATEQRKADAKRRKTEAAAAAAVEGEAARKRLLRCADEAELRSALKQIRVKELRAVLTYVHVAVVDSAGHARLVAALRDAALAHFAPLLTGVCCDKCHLADDDPPMLLCDAEGCLVSHQLFAPTTFVRAAGQMVLPLLRRAAPRPRRPASRGIPDNHWERIGTVRVAGTRVSFSRTHFLTHRVCRRTFLFDNSLWHHLFIYCGEPWARAWRVSRTVITYIFS